MKLVYLPPYSPDLNPNENAFAKIKAILRKAGARTCEAFWQAIGKAIEGFPRMQCVNFFQETGYAA